MLFILTPFLFFVINKADRLPEYHQHLECIQDISFFFFLPYTNNYSTNWLMANVEVSHLAYPFNKLHTIKATMMYKIPVRLECSYNFIII